MSRYWMGAMVVMAGLWIGAPAVQAQQSGGPLVYVNLDTVFTNFFKTKAANDQLQEQADSFKDERKELIDQYEKLKNDYRTLRDRALDTALSEESRNELRRQTEEKLVEIKDDEAKIRRFDESRQRKLDEQSLRMRRRLIGEINEKIAAYARDQGYSGVVDSSGMSMNGVPILVYVDPNLDITARVIDVLNQ
ncbi:MAG: OmpH family outer membrane protein [Verrucomicrobia bacterium]|nr:OmpH family outer membrane protein [Kiritimatiellia bacterium]MCP5488764.1 OmpH family outer membrane protein [Verrucomicrobiota bacterium]